MICASRRFKWVLSVTCEIREPKPRVYVARLHVGHRDVRTSPHCVVESRLLPVVDDHLLLLNFVNAASKLFCTTSLQYIRRYTMYSPWRGSHLNIVTVGSK